MGWFQKLVLGVDLDEEQKRQEELDRAHAARNRELFDRGLWTEEDYNGAEQRRLETVITDPEAEVYDAFRQGLDEGAANIRGAVGGVVNTVVTTPLKLIPWQLWLIGGVFLAWKMGLFRGPTRKP